MFRCKECQSEYKIKPDYCDCGNDTFDEIVEQMPQAEIPKSQPKPVLAPDEKPKHKEKKKSQVDAISWIMFSLCMLLSFIVIFFVGNPKDEPVKEQKQEVKTDTSYIPRSTNAFWDNTVKKVKPEPQKETPQKIIEQIIPKVVQPKPAPVVKKTTPKPVAQPAKQTSVQLPKSITDITNKSQTTQPKTQTTVKPVQAATTQPKAEPKKLNQHEYANYKINLRNTIASKINFAGVIGDGDCVVSFSISNNGTLINRKFEKQSTNNTLNDAVYHAIMQTPGFKNPPEGYNGQTMRFTVKMYSGNFEVTLN